MKPTDKQLEEIKTRIATARERSELSDAEIARISNVHPSQVSRICGGSFKTFSNNVMQICSILGVAVTRLEPGADLAWLQAQSSMRRLWDETPEGAEAIVRLLEAIAELQTTRKV